MFTLTHLMYTHSSPHKAKVKSTLYSLYILYVPNTRLVASLPKENLGMRQEYLLVSFPDYDY